MQIRKLGSRGKTYGLEGSEPIVPRVNKTGIRRVQPSLCVVVPWNLLCSNTWVYLGLFRAMGLFIFTSPL